MSFIIRPIKSYATVSLELEDGTVVSEGDIVEVVKLKADNVVGKHKGNEVSIPLSMYTHAFSNRNLVTGNGS